MKKIRTQIKEIKEGFLNAKIKEKYPAYVCANAIFIFCVFIIIYTISAIVCNYFMIIGLAMIAISIILVLVFLFSQKAFCITLPISMRIFNYFFARYGKVITRNDWKRIRKNNKKAYKLIWDKNSIGKCYGITYILATWIKDAKIMYCSIECKNGRTAHAVLLKNNCIYDTNIRQHYDYDEYIEMLKVEVYQIFEKEVYSKRSFFDDIRDDFKKWCAERNVYCDPQ